MTKVIELNLTEEEIKKIKKDFNDGQVYTDGCFCGHAISNFRDNLYVFVNFSCRKSMCCNNSYYQVTDISIVEKANKIHSIEVVNNLINDIENNESDDVINKIDGRDFVFANSYYDDVIHEDVYLYCEDLKFDSESLKAIQKKLFKKYKKSYGEGSDAKFKDVGQFNY